jgi:1-phosphofructokinase
MIYTLTCAPSLDYYMELPSLLPDTVNRASTVRYELGGKGLNVSRVLKTLGVESTAIVLTGGFVGAEIVSRCKETGLNIINIEDGSNSRINVKLPSHEINACSPLITERVQKAIKIELDKCTESDIVIVSGQTANIEYLCGGCKAKLIFDVSGQTIAEALSLKPFLMKPNHLELCDYFCSDTTTDKETLIGFAKRLIDKGAENVLLSMGSEGLMLINKNDVYFEAPKAGKAVNTVAAGDACLAGFLAHLSKGGSLEEAAYFANITGAAAAFSEGLPTLSDIEKLL